jgi:hypothetical protein
MQNEKDSIGKSLDRQLIDAAVAGDLAAVRRLLEEGADTQISRNDFDTVTQNFSVEDRNRHSDVFTLIGQHSGQNRLNAAVYLAAFHGFDEIVIHFLAKSAYDPMTLKVAVFGAARAGHTALVARLVDAGAAADFKEDYPLRQSIIGGHQETAKLLAKKTGAENRALGYAIAAGNIDLAADFLTQDTDVAIVLEHIAFALGDAQTPPQTAKRQRDEAGILAGFQMVLGFAEARGNDMQHFMMTAATAAARHESLPLISDIRGHPLLPEMPNKEAILTAMLLEKPPVNSATAAYSNLMVRLIEGGGDADKGLRIGVAQSDVAMVEAALRKRSDPRRGREAVIDAAFDIADKAVTNKTPPMRIFGSLLAVQAAMIVMDETVHGKGLAADDPLSVWRQVDPATGKSGLMSVFAIGKVDDYLAALRRNGEQLSLSDLLHQDKSGYRALDCLDDMRQLETLFVQELWQNRRDEYQKFWQALTPPQQEEQHAAHKALLQRWQTEDMRQRVSDLARQHRGRFKL